MTPSKSADDIFRSASIREGSDETGGFNVIRYPADLASAQHPHYVMFFVNVRTSDIKGLANAPETVDVKFDNTKMNRTNTEGDAKVVGAIAGGQAGFKAGGGIGRQLNDLADNFRQGASLRVGAAGAGIGVLGGIAGTLAAGDRSQILLKDVIALYMAGKPTVSYGASWGEEDLGLVGAFADGANPFNSLASGAGAAAGALMMKGAESAGSNILGNAGKAVQGTLALTPNPFKAQLFKSMKFRTFSYTYDFLPKDENEYRSVRRIINTFKKYMHPSLGAGKFVLRYPAEFSIAYYYKGSTNAELFRISNCALTDATVEYGGTDFVTFRDGNGAPAEITLKLKFTELETLTQERFNDREF